MAGDQRSRFAKALVLKSLIQRNRQRRRLLLTSILSAIKRRRLLLKLCFTALLLTLNASKNRAVVRSCRRLERNGGWWDVVWNTYSDARFKKTFRVNKKTFLFILDKIKHVLKREIVTEDLISTEQRLAVCLYRFGRGDYFYTISQMTGLGTSTVCKIV